MDFFNKYILNKYTITGLIFLVIWIYYDQESLVDQYKLHKIERGLEEQKQYYIDEIKKDEEAIDLLQNDSVFLEKYAREKYYMKKSDEDVYVIIDDEQDN